MFVYPLVLFGPDFSFIVGYMVVSRPFLDLANARMNGLSQEERMEVIILGRDASAGVDVASNDNTCCCLLSDCGAW